MTMLSLRSLAALARWDSNWLMMMVTRSTEMGRKPNCARNSRNM